MNIRKFTKPVQMSLSGLLIGSLLAVLIGLPLIPPVFAAVGPIGPVVRTLPATVQLGDTFEVEISFEAPADDFNSLGFHDVAPTTPSDWLTEADKTWCSPEAFTALGDKSDNIAEYSWLGPFDEGESFTAIYEVTVPSDALPGTYAFPVDDDTKAWLTYHIGLDAYKVPVTGDFEVEIAKPGGVWVDDDFDASTPGWGYDHFATIQDGIDGVGSSTVNVLAGTYDAFKVEDRNDMDIIGEAGVVVNSADYYSDLECYIMARVMNSTGITIEKFDFDGSGISEDVIVGICYVGSTGSITDVTVSDVVGSEMGVGIDIWGGEIDTVNISDSTVEGCQVGVMVGADQANLENCVITGLAGGDVPSYGIIAMSGAIVNIESCEISDCRVDEPTEGNAGLGIFVGGELPEPEAFAERFGGVVVDGEVSKVKVTGCSKILDNNLGIVVYEGGALVANGNNIVGNDILGVYNDATGEVDAEENWWGDENGPTHEDNPLTTTGDEVSDNVDYVPWLDAPCPGGEPVGPVADFSATPRRGRAPLTVEFTDESTGTFDFDIVSWVWDFDNNGTEDSNEQNPSHTYRRAGSYTVSLTVTDELDLSDTETKTKYITVLTEVVEIAGVLPGPAGFSASYLNISPQQVLPNQQVEISINISNTGEERGSHTVALYINGSAEQSQTIGVSPGSSKLVVFKVTKLTQGTYQVSVEGAPGQFTVLAPAAAPTGFGGPLGTGGIIAIVVVVIALVCGLVFGLRRE